MNLPSMDHKDECVSVVQRDRRATLTLINDCSISLDERLYELSFLNMPGVMCAVSDVGAFVLSL